MFFIVLFIPALVCACKGMPRFITVVEWYSRNYPPVLKSMAYKLRFSKYLLQVQHMPLFLCIRKDQSSGAGYLSQWVSAIATPYWQTALTFSVVLGLSSAVLFITLSFLASFVVVFFFPSLAAPSVHPMKAGSIRDTFVSPLTVANGIIGYALRTYQYFSPWSIWQWGYDDAWEDSDLEDVPTEPVDLKSMGLLEWLLHRFLLGLSAIGSFSFVSLLWQTKFSYQRFLKRDCCADSSLSAYWISSASVVAFVAGTIDERQQATLLPL